MLLYTNRSENNTQNLTNRSLSVKHLEQMCFVDFVDYNEIFEPNLAQHKNRQPSWQNVPTSLIILDDAPPY